MVNEMWMRLHRMFDVLQFGKVRRNILRKNRDFWTLVEEPFPDDAHLKCTRMVYGLFRGVASVEEYVRNEKYNARYRDVSQIAKGVWEATAYYRETADGPEHTVKVRLRAGLMTVLECPLKEQDPLRPDAQTLKVFEG